MKILNLVVTSVADKNTKTTFAESDDLGLIVANGKKTAKGHMRCVINDSASYVQGDNRIKVSLEEGITLMPGDSILVGEKKTEAGLPTGEGWMMVFTAKTDLPEVPTEMLDAVVKATPAEVAK